MPWKRPLISTRIGDVGLLKLMLSTTWTATLWDSPGGRATSGQYPCSTSKSTRWSVLLTNLVLKNIINRILKKRRIGNEEEDNWVSHCIYLCLEGYCWREIRILTSNISSILLRYWYWLYSLLRSLMFNIQISKYINV